MRENKDWSYFEFQVGRYVKGAFDGADFEPYKPQKDRLTWYVFNEEQGRIVPINIFEYNWIFLKSLIEIKEAYPDDFEMFANEVRSALSHEYWSRSEYETIVTSWPPYVDSGEVARLNSVKKEFKSKYGNFIRTDVRLETAFKIDVYTQIMLNWDRFIEYVWNNKELISRKAFGLKDR